MELHTLPNEGVYVYQTQRNNQPWYVIIFGQFDSFQLAKEAGVELASSSSELSAWVEMYETIHQDLRLINE
ncbi:MAG: SPOR domain-containing protein [Psychromonas sp.]